MAFFDWMRGPMQGVNRPIGYPGPSLPQQPQFGGPAVQPQPFRPFMPQQPSFGGFGNGLQPQAPPVYGGGFYGGQGQFHTMPATTQQMPLSSLGGGNRWRSI